MKTLRHFAAIVALTFLAAPGALAFDDQVGQAKLSGKVTDEKGQPLEGVEVKATLEGGGAPAREAKTSKKGEWTIAGLASGSWVVAFSKDGFDSQEGKVPLNGDQSQNVSVTLAKHVERVDPAAELNAAAQKGIALLGEQKYADARKIFEDLLAKYPDVKQLNAYIAQSYAAENNLEKAVEHMKIAVDADPANDEMKLVLADLMMEKGDRTAALELMQSVDLAKIKDPTPLINGAIVLINDKKIPEAIEFLNRIAAQFPNEAQTYYYRGRAFIASDKLPEAKADLEKFVSLAQPTARELPDAKKILEQLDAAK